MSARRLCLHGAVLEGHPPPTSVKGSLGHLGHSVSLVLGDPLEQTRW